MSAIAAVDVRRCASRAKAQALEIHVDARGAVVLVRLSESRARGQLELRAFVT
jgi:hypothetical protein